MLLLVVVKILVMPLLAWSLLPGAFRLVRWWLLPTSIFKLVPMGRSLFVLARIAGVGWSFRNWVSTTVSRLRFTSNLAEALLPGAASLTYRLKVKEFIAYKPRSQLGNGISVIYLGYIMTSCPSFLFFSIWSWWKYSKSMYQCSVSI